MCVCVCVCVCVLVCLLSLCVYASDLTLNHDAWVYDIPKALAHLEALFVQTEAVREHLRKRGGEGEGYGRGRRKRGEEGRGRWEGSTLLKAHC